MTTINSTNSIIYLMSQGGNLFYQINSTSGSWITLTGPITINNTSPSVDSIVRVLFYTDIEINSQSQILVCNSDYVVIDGNNYNLNVTGVTNYSGFVVNGTVSENGFSNVTVIDIHVPANNSTLADGAGWVCSSYFGNGATGNLIEECFNYADIAGVESGGICGTHAGNNGTLTIRSCENSGGSSAFACGGICGGYTGANSGDVTIEHCYNYGPIFYNSGGICGGTGNEVFVSGCVNDATIGDYGGGICGEKFSGTIQRCSNSGALSESSGGICGTYAGLGNKIVTITNCSNTGNMENFGNSGGICGSNISGSILIEKCYNTGSILGGVGSGGICGGFIGFEINYPVVCQILSCYNIGNITNPATECGGIIGGNMGAGIIDGGSVTVNVTDCYMIGDIVANSSAGICGNTNVAYYNDAYPVVNIINCYTLNGSLSVEEDYLNINNIITFSNCYTAGGAWSDAAANSALSPLNVWLPIGINNPYLLATFDLLIYDPPSAENTNNDYESVVGLYSNEKEHSIISVNGTESEYNITIDEETGIITFSDLEANGSMIYVVKVLIYNLTSGKLFGYYIGTFTLTQTVPPTSNICFPAGTPVNTDQGIILIENISNNNTINKKKIVEVVKIKPNNNKLIFIPKHSITKNYPNADTFISENHKIYYNKKMICARYLRLFNKNIKYINHTHKYLYNILMEKYGTINVNNLICETLHPENHIAQTLLKNKN